MGGHNLGLLLGLGAIAAAAYGAGDYSGDYACPKSPAYVYASCRVTVIVHLPCFSVREEMLSRVYGQFDMWHDPHNNGTYNVLERGEYELWLTRRTGDDKYTDKLTFTFEDVRRASSHHCVVRGCSRSQVFSVGDFSTNYCNLRMLYCGAGDGCSALSPAWPASPSETEVKASPGAGTSQQACIAASRSHGRPALSGGDSGFRVETSGAQKP